MRGLCVISFCAIALTSTGVQADDFIDRIDDALTISAFHDTLRTRLSGLIDLEFYHVEQPPPGLIDTTRNSLFNPRLSLFLDSQLGSRVYFFLESRLDRGFDPSDRGAQVRLDEYALRLSVLDDARLNLQVGKFATVVGNWVERHLSWQNPFVTAPLPYENLTPISDKIAPFAPSYFDQEIVAGRYENNPLIWGPSYTTGISVAGQLGKFDYAIEVKNAALASRPESWDATEVGFNHPTVSGRGGFRPNESWNLGFSASSGPYFRPEADWTLPSGKNIGDYHEFLLGQDISFAWRHIQLWAEFYEVRFEVPRVGNADTFAYYLEGKYKITPQLFGALRWNQQLFGTVPNGYGGETPWGHDIWQVDAAVGYRFTAHTQLKLQYSLQDESGTSRDLSHSFAAQFTVRF